VHLGDAGLLETDDKARQDLPSSWYDQLIHIAALVNATRVVLAAVNRSAGTLVHNLAIAADHGADQDAIASIRVLEVAQLIGITVLETTTFRSVALRGEEETRSMAATIPSML